MIVNIILVVALVVVVIHNEITVRRIHRDLMVERSELLNRIKPETAQIVGIETPELVEPARTDEDYWQSHETKLLDDGTFPFGGEEEVRGR